MDLWFVQHGSSMFYFSQKLLDGGKIMKVFWTYVCYSNLAREQPSVRAPAHKLPLWSVPALGHLIDPRQEEFWLEMVRNNIFFSLLSQSSLIAFSSLSLPVLKWFLSRREKITYHCTVALSLQIHPELSSYGRLEKKPFFFAWTKSSCCWSNSCTAIKMRVLTG